MLNKLLISARAMALGVALSTASLPAAADSVSDAKLEELQKKLDQSMKMIEALGARVKELEGHASMGPVAAGAAPAPNPQRLEAVEQKVAQIETANATRQSDDSGLPIHGFADVNVGNHNLYFPYAKGTNVGSLDFYLAPKLGDRVVSLAELIFETGPDGHVGTDLERFQIGYQFNDQATVWVGRFHTPYGVMPAHTTGVWVTGAQREANGKFLYDFYVGNGQQIQGGTLDMQTGGNGHGAAIAGTRLSYQFTGGAVDGLLVGVNGFTDKVNDDSSTNPALVRLNMVGAYAVYDTDTWEHIIEAYSFHNKNLNGSPGTHRSEAWFAQFGYRAGWGVPYIRYERAMLDQSDPYFNEQTFGASYYRSALGVRFDINAKASIKFEVAHTRNTDVRPATDYRPSDAEIGLPQQFNEILAQYAVRF